MGKHGLSTPNEDCRHSTYGKFCKCDQTLIPYIWVGPGDEAISYAQSAITTSQYGCVATIEILFANNYKQIRIGLKNDLRSDLGESFWGRACHHIPLDVPCSM